MERDLGAWDEIYRNARKSEKLKFEANERDEGELERTGQPVSIYEIYNGAGAWPFMHHGSLYRGLSLVRSIHLLFLSSHTFHLLIVSVFLVNCIRISSTHLCFFKTTPICFTSKLELC